MEVLTYSKLPIENMSFAYYLVMEGIAEDKTGML